MSDRRNIDRLLKAMKDSNNKKTEPYDTEATVRRVEDGIAYVHLDGGVDETPVKLTINAQAGDRVQVRVGGGSAWLTGNGSAPPTDDRMAIVANTTAEGAQTLANLANESAQNAVISAATAAEAAADAQASADSARDSLKSVVQGATTVEKAVSVMQTALEAVVDYDPTTDTTQEYFWHDANGAHILGDTSGYRNDIDSTGMRIVDVSTEESVAEFSATESRIGAEDEQHIVIDSDSVGFFNGTDKQIEMGVDSQDYYSIKFGNSRNQYDDAPIYVRARNVESSIAHNQYLQLQVENEDDAEVAAVGVDTSTAGSNKIASALLTASLGTVMAELKASVTTTNGARLSATGDFYCSGDIYTSNGMIGERVNAEPSAVNVYNSTGTSGTGRKFYQIASLTLETGVWAVFYAAQFSSTGGATGVRFSALYSGSITNGSTTEPTGGLGIIYQDVRTGISGMAVTNHGSGRIVVSSGTTTARLTVWQNSSASAGYVPVVGRMYAVRIV